LVQVTFLAAFNVNFRPSSFAWGNSQVRDCALAQLRDAPRGAVARHRTPGRFALFGGTPRWEVSATPRSGAGHSMLCPYVRLS